MTVWLRTYVRRWLRCARLALFVSDEDFCRLLNDLDAHRRTWGCWR